MLPRIVHVASGRQWRGGERQVWLLARALGGLGLHQLVITRRGSRLAAELTAAGVAVREVGWRIGLSPAAAAAVLLESRRGPTLLHAHDPHSLTITGAVASLLGVPFVVTRRVELPLRRRALWSRARRVIAISAAVQAALERSGIAPAAIEVIPSGIDLDRPRPPAAPVGPPRIVAIGALTPEKNHLLLLDVAARLVQRHPAVRWTVAGEGPLKSRLLDAARARGLGDVVEFIGQFSEPRQVLAGATVFLSCSTHEGLGTAILEAMAAGVPVVATAVGGVPEVLSGGAGILVDQGNPEAMAGALDALLRDESARRNVIETAAMRVKSYSVERMATAVAGVYRSVAMSVESQ